MTQPHPPAGWYDDGSGHQRWWDGARWADLRQPHAATPVPPHPEATPAQVVAPPRTVDQGLLSTPRPGRKLSRIVITGIAAASVVAACGIGALVIWGASAATQATARGLCATPSASAVSSVLGASTRFTGVHTDNDGYTNCNWKNDEGADLIVASAPLSRTAPSTTNFQQITLPDGTSALVNLDVNDSQSDPPNIAWLVFDRGSRHWDITLGLATLPLGGSHAMQQKLIHVAATL